MQFVHGSRFTVLRKFLSDNRERTTDNQFGFTLIELLVARHPKLQQRKTNLGFTLIELLVVVAIIGVLVSFAAVSYTQAQLRARDGERKSDIENIRSALELYFSDNNTYPATATWVNDLENGGYITIVPTDPQGGANYTYGSGAGSCGGPPYCVYVIYACLENENDPDRLADDGDGSDPCLAPMEVDGRVGYAKNQP